jgi:hypothetical protein
LAAAVELGGGLRQQADRNSTASSAVTPPPLPAAMDAAYVTDRKKPRSVRG